MISVQIHRKKYHQSIRIQQLSQMFNNTRMLFRQLNSQEAVQILQTMMTHLTSSLLQNDIKRIKLSLIQLHNVASQYMIAHFLIRQIKLPMELQSVNYGSFPIQCSWINILLILINQYDSELWEECSALLNCSLYQIRKILDNQNGHEYYPQLQWILQNFPMHLLFDAGKKVCINLLDALQQILQPEQNHELVIRFLLKPRNFLSTLNSLYRHNNIIFYDFQERVVNTSLMVLSITSKYMLLNQEIQFLANFTKNLLVSKIQKEQLSDILFKKLRALSLSNVALNCQDILIVQKIFHQQVHKKNVVYLQMVNAIQYTSEVILSCQSLRIILNHLCEQIYDENELYFRQWLSILMYKNILLMNKNIISHLYLPKIILNQPYLIFSERLQKLIQLAKDKRQALFTLIIEILWELMKYSQQFYNGRLLFLQKYQKWELLLQNRNIDQNIKDVDFS